MLAAKSDPACCKETGKACLALVLSLLLLNTAGEGEDTLSISSDWMALGMRVKGLEAQVVFS